MLSKCFNPWNNIGQLSGLFKGEPIPIVRSGAHKAFTLLSSVSAAPDPNQDSEMIQYFYPHTIQ